MLIVFPILLHSHLFLKTGTVPKIINSFLSYVVNYSIFLIWRATPSAAGLFQLLAVAIWGAYCLHFGTLGYHFSTSAEPWVIIFASRDHPGESWEQQDGHEVIRNRISGWFWDPISRVCLAPRLEIQFLFRACFLAVFLLISESQFRRLGLLMQVFVRKV